MDSSEIRDRFLKFFEKRGHAIIPSASLVPENDPSVLFNTAGMQPLVPYLMGTPHPRGKRIVDSQKCVRTGDIDEIGDNTHATFFEMLGNWSLGDYFKEDAIKWSYEFLTSKEDGLGLDPGRLYVTVFEGDENAPRDLEAFEIWKKYIPEHRIYFMSAKSNWWSPGDNGPCGPDTEMFYDVTPDALGDMTRDEYLSADERQEVVEIWNNVFMEYEKKDGKVIGKLAMKNVDTGAGLERTTMVVQGKNNIFETDLFAPLIAKIKEFSQASDVRAERIIADHVRTSVFMIADGVTPSNTDRGYILRRLLRRAVRYSDVLRSQEGMLSALVDVVSLRYADAYKNIPGQASHIADEIRKEEEKFRKTLTNGLKELRKVFERIRTLGSVVKITGKVFFDLFQTHGFPLEMSIEEIKNLAKTFKYDLRIDEEQIGLEFLEEMKGHQEISRQGSEQKFKGGLADTSEMSVKYHTATHMLHKALKIVLGEHVEQKGSNITAERLRFDFSHTEKMTDEQKKAVEDLINKKISEALPVKYDDISMDEAKKRGAIGLFEEKYGDLVRVYQVGENDKKFSIELCGGPHVENTSTLGHFKILKEEAVAQGIRRIKAVLE